MKAVNRLRGMRDLTQESWLQKRGLEDGLINLLGSCGYRYLQVPILEATELFLRKSGGELASQLYGFTDAGSNSVSLRPEFTSSVMRHYLEHARDIPLPARWQYSGPVFRYGAAERQPGESGQFTQVGAELIGSDNVVADAELLSMAAQVPARLGLNDCRLELADMEVLNELLDLAQLSDRARSFVIASVPQLREGPSALSAALERSRQLHLAGHSSREENLGVAIAGLDEGQARKVLHGFLEWSAGDAQRLGQRSPEQVVDRLFRRLRGSDEVARLERGLELVTELVGIRGEPGKALDRASAMMQRAGVSSTALSRLSRLVDLVLGAEPALQGRLVLDFGLVRGLAYYNGIIFEAKHPSGAASLGGGGRYDGLSRALGSDETVPALGFAYNLDALMALIDTEIDTEDGREKAPNGGVGPEGLMAWQSKSLVVSESPGGCENALKIANQIRREGHFAQLEVNGRSTAESVSYAGRQGFDRVVIVGDDGQATIQDIE